MQHDDLPDISLLSLKELQDEYLRLYGRFQLLNEQSEADAQCIHELKRNLKTATATESYLAHELEQLTLAQNNVELSEFNKLHSELEQMRKKHNELVTELSTSQNDTESLKLENSDLRKQVDTLKQQHSKATTETVSTPNTQQLEREQQLQKDNVELLQKLEEFQEVTMQSTIAIADREKKIEILQDQVNCLEENMQSKRSELEELTQLLESTQEQLMEAKATIAMLTSSPDNFDRKGNSLFAEVDDQRQAMKQLLASQKKSYLEMKKIYNDSEHEIRRLKRENLAMHTELQTCSTLFCSADRTYQEKLKSRIIQLVNQNEELEKQLNCCQERLRDLASNKGVSWINSMLNFCKQETDELKKQLHSERFQCGTLEEQLRTSQQDIARWRFESLKSRCILLDRENLLTENKILFKPNNAIEFRATETQLKNARPRILCTTIDSILNSYSKPESEIEQINLNINVKTEENLRTPEVNNIGLCENLALKSEISNNPIELTETEVSISSTENKENMGKIVNLPNEGISTKIEGSLLVKDIKKLQSTPYVTKKPQSILCNNPFGNEIKKAVKFTNDELKTDEICVSHANETKSNVRKVRTKSNVIVKHITVNSKIIPK